MCGRTACTLAPDELRRASRYRDRNGKRRRPKWRDGDAEKYRPSYNKSPQSSSPVLLSSRHFNKEAAVDKCVLATMRWGLVPAWFKQSDPSKMHFSTSNCRSESLLEKKSYKEPLLKGQRCVILADGFYEWRKMEKNKQPFFIYFPQSRETRGSRQSEKADEKNQDDKWAGWRVLTMAGLFDSWTPPGGGETLYSYTIITVNAAPNLQSIHDRMPAILDGDEEVRRWLDFDQVHSLDALKLIHSKSCLTFHTVSSLVNNSRNNSAECLQPLDTSKKQASSSSKAMMSWLESASPVKRKQPESDDETKGGSEGKQNKPEPKYKPRPAVSLLQNWLLPHSVPKRPRM